MADISKWTNSKTNTTYNLKDAQARSDITALSQAAVYDRQAELGVYAGRDLQTVLGVSDFSSVVSALHTRIANDNYEGLRIGDYMNVACGALGTIRFDLAHVNPYYRMGDSEMGKHLCFVANKPIALPSDDPYVTNSSRIMWNTTNTNQGTSTEACPYLASNLKAWETNRLLALMPSTLTQYLIDRREWLETRYTAGQSLTASTGATWKGLGKVWSLSEMEVYGTVVWGTPGYSVGISRQLDYFKNIHNQIPERTSWWLRVVSGSSASYVCCVYNSGIANYHSATGTAIRPRPGFLLG